MATEILFLIGVRLKQSIPDSQVEHLENVLAQSISEFLQMTGHEPEGVVVSVCVNKEEPEEPLH